MEKQHQFSQSVEESLSVYFSILSKKNIISKLKESTTEKLHYFQIGAELRVHNVVASAQLIYRSCAQAQIQPHQRIQKGRTDTPAQCLNSKRLISWMCKGVPGSTPSPLPSAAPLQAQKTRECQQVPLLCN